MGEVTYRRIGIVYYQHETLGLFGYSVYFQRWTDVLAVTSEAFWDVSADSRLTTLSFGPMTTDPNPVEMPVAPVPVSGNPDQTAVGRTARSLDD
jgi:hypothetical protein